MTNILLRVELIHLLSKYYVLIILEQHVVHFESLMVVE